MGVQDRVMRIVFEIFGLFGIYGVSKLASDFVATQYGHLGLIIVMLTSTWLLVRELFGRGFLNDLQAYTFAKIMAGIGGIIAILTFMSWGGF